MNERNMHMNKKWWIAICGILLFVATGVLPVAASVLPDYHNIFIQPANGARFNDYSNNTYFFKLGGSGLNALHITNDPKNATSGQVTTTTTTSGSFWITDTGGRGYSDDAVLLIAVNGSVTPTLRVYITSRGYTWTPTGSGDAPAEGTITYNTAAVNNAEFNSSHVLLYSGSQVKQTWKPSTSVTYPIYSGEDTSLTLLNNFRLIPVDLKVGVLGTGLNASYYQNLTDWGAVRVDYTIANLQSNSNVAFNAYAYTNQSNQGRGISWTNKVNAAGQSTSGASGWRVIP
jgi:hypothetical protein